MAIPLGVETIVGELRSATSANTDDEFHGETYWSDEQLYAVLERHSTYRSYPLRVIKRDPRGAVWQYQKWEPRNRNERYHGDGEAVVITERGVDVTADCTVNLSNRTVIIGDNTPKSNFTIQLLVYDFNEAAAEVWERKAEHRDFFVRTKSGQHTLYMEQERDFCLAQAKRYRSRKIRAFNWSGNSYV